MMVYNTPRGETYEPLTVELWRWDGGAPLGRLDQNERVSVTWEERGSGTAEIITPVSPLSTLLLETDSSILVVVTMNGCRHVSTVVKSSIEGGDGKEPLIHAVTASAWHLLDGERLPPNPDYELSMQSSAQWEMTGPVESVVKYALDYGASRLEHPIYVSYDVGQGPEVTAVSKLDSVSDVVKAAVAGTGWRLVLDPWMPGDAGVDGFTFSMPSLIAYVMPYRETPGLVWSGEDITDFKATYDRAQYDRIIVTSGSSDDNKKYAEYVDDQAQLSPWSWRESTTQANDKADPATVAQAELVKARAASSVDVTIAPGNLWEFGSDGAYPRQFDVGDIATIQLPVIGEVKQVITSVSVELTPTSFTVTPKVSTPDTEDRDLFTTIATLAARLDKMGQY